MQYWSARAAIGWGQEELAEAVGVSRPTVTDFERGQRQPMPNNVKALRTALEGKGIRFWEVEDGRSGIDFPEADQS